MYFAFLEQDARHIIVAVDDGREQRRDAILIGSIDIRAGFHQHWDTIDAAIAGSKFQRCQSAERQPLFPGFCRVLPFPFVDVRARIHIGALRNQLTRRGGMLF